MCKHKRTYLQKVLAFKKKQRNKKEEEEEEVFDNLFKIVEN